MRRLGEQERADIDAVAAMIPGPAFVRALLRGVFVGASRLGVLRVERGMP